MKITCCLDGEFNSGYHMAIVVAGGEERESGGVVDRWTGGRAAADVAVEDINHHCHRLHSFVVEVSQLHFILTLGA